MRMRMPPPPFPPAQKPTPSPHPSAAQTAPTSSPCPSPPPPPSLTRQLQPHHDHARDPEEEDVVASLQQRARVKLVQVGALLRPLEHAERKQAGREPRVQHVLRCGLCGSVGGSMLTRPSRVLVHE
eukprot:90662-Chlamydomonas_euryale.AAC.2